MQPCLAGRDVLNVDNRFYMRFVSTSVLVAGSLAFSLACHPGPVLGGGSQPSVGGTIAVRVSEASESRAACRDGRRVTAINVATGARYETTTSVTGGYTIKVPEGGYRLDVELRQGETMAKRPDETRINNSDLDSARDFEIAVKLHGPVVVASPAMDARAGSERSQPSARAYRLRGQCPLAGAWRSVFLSSRRPPHPPLRRRRSRGPAIRLPRRRAHRGGRRPVRRRLAGRGARRHLVRDQPRRQRRAEGQERRLARLRRQVPLCRLRVRRSRPAADPRAVRGPRQRRGSYTDYGGVILDTRNDGKTAPLFLAKPRGDPVRRRDRRRDGARTRRPTSTGIRRGASPTTAGRSRSASRSRRCATATPIRRPGGSCSTATTRATSATRSSPRSCRAT